MELTDGSMKNWTDAERAEFVEWWNHPDRINRPSPVLRALVQRTYHTALAEHEAEFPADMGIGSPAP